jgi:hypothetical protein
VGAARAGLVISLGPFTELEMVDGAVFGYG